MNDETLYSVDVVSWDQRTTILRVTGKRDTVLEMAMRVILDMAPKWSEAGYTSPMFQVRVFKVTK